MYGEIEGAVSNNGWTMIPRPNRRLTALAQELARCAGALLPAGAGLFLGLEINAAGVLRMLWWRSDDLGLVAEIHATPDAFCPADSQEGALQQAAHALLDYLAGRWPSPPNGFGVITDGVGVGFAPDNPAPSASGWLMRHASGANQLLAITPLDPTGPCAILRPDGAGSLH